MRKFGTTAIFSRARPKKRCLELSGAQNSSVYWVGKSSRHLFLGRLSLIHGRSVMSMKCRACVVGLNILALFAFLASLQPGGAKAQVKMAVQAVAPAPPGAGPATPGGDGEFTDAIQLPRDREVKKHLEAATDYIAKEQWVEACRFLQSVLERKEDVFVQVHRKGADKQDKVRWVSAKTESNRLIGDMKPRGLETYELENGGLAKGQLADAKKTGDPQLLAEIAQRYFHT